MEQQNVLDGQSSIYVQEGVDKGRIANPDDAYKLAEIENKLGQESRVNVEGRMEREAMTGLTDEQRRNYEVMDGIEKKYPDAFVKKVDDKGREILILHCLSDSTSQEYPTHFKEMSLVFTRDGLYAMHNKPVGGEKGLIEIVDWTKFGNAVESKLYGREREKPDFDYRDLHINFSAIGKDTVLSAMDKQPSSVEGSFGANSSMLCQEHNLLNEKIRRLTAKALVGGQVFGVREKEKEEAERRMREMTSTEILKDL